MRATWTPSPRLWQNAKRCVLFSPNPSSSAEAKHVLERLKGQLLAFPQHSTGWSVVIALGITTIVSYGTTQYLFGVLEVPLATTFAWSRAELSGAYALSLLVAGVLGVPLGRSELPRMGIAP